MKRSHVLFLGIVVLLVVAVTLRTRSWLVRPEAAVPADLPATPALSAPGEPIDFVARPCVVPDEAAHGPRRLISLAPSITEIVCALGMRDRLVGRTPYCTYPPGLDDVPAVGALLDTNYEKIKSLTPDLVLVTENSVQVAAELRQLSIRYAPIPHNTLDEVYRAIEVVGSLCGRPKTAASLVAAIRADMERLRQAALREEKDGQRVLVILGALPVPPQAVFAAGPGSFLETLLQYAGQRNAAAEVLKVSHGEIPLEKLPFLDPDVILEFREPVRSQEMRDLYQQWAQVGPMSAIRAHRVCSVGGAEWLSAGPRIAVELHRFIAVMAGVGPPPGGRTLARTTRPR